MEVKVEHIHDKLLIATNEDNQTILMGWGEDNRLGFRPMEAVLACLASCSMVDVVEIIRKMRKSIERFFVEVRGERVDDYPRVFSKIKLTYVVYSRDLKPEELEKAVKLSMEKYCSVAAMLRRGGVEITFSQEVRYL